MKTYTNRYARRSAADWTTHEPGCAGERGAVFIVVIVFLATAIAGLASISSWSVLHESRSQAVLESEARALNSAYAQIHLAMNVVNTSPYDAQNHNLVLRGALAETPTATEMTRLGGETSGYLANDGSAEETDALGHWLDDAADPAYGLIPSTNVRVYRAGDYLQRLQRLKGETITVQDPTGLSENYYILEATGRVGDTIRLVSALVRENEPYSAFVFFQNRATLGVSGSPRGLTHCNEDIAFYFPNGNYVDSVSAVTGFEYMAGATEANTNIRDGNPTSARIELSKVDFAELKLEADTFVGQTGLDAEVKMYSDGRVRIREYTPPRHEMQTQSYTYNKYIGYHDETYMGTEQQVVGTQDVPYDEQVLDHYDTVSTTSLQQVQTGTTTETRTRNVQVQTGTQDVVMTRQDPVYESQVVTKYRWVQVWEPYDQGDAGGGTSVGGGGDGELGEYVWVQEPYETTEMVQVGTVTVEYTVTQPVYETVTETYTVTVPVYEEQLVTTTTQVPVYTTVTKYRTENIYETVEVEKTRRVNDYEPTTVTWEEEVFISPVLQDETYLTLDPAVGSTIYIDGRITKLYGDLQGRLTIVGNEKVRITGSIRYVDDNGNTAMNNGDDYTKPYERNSAYTGRSTLGVIARDDILMTDSLPAQAELNGTFMAVEGRVGIDGFWADDTGELHQDSTSARNTYLTAEQRAKERAYDRTSYDTDLFVRDSLRRIGGIVSNNRVMETYVTAEDGTSKVSAGFKRGHMEYDTNVLFNPPPNFVEVPRPVLLSFVPIMFMRDEDS